MKRAAFTLLEMTMVIVVLGILAALALPRLERDIRQEAADNILSAIRYTQHMALMDNKTDPEDANWQKELWHMRFSLDGAGGYFYTVSTNTDQNANVDKGETAVDPANGKYMFNLGGDSAIDSDESPNIFIGKKYGVNQVTPSGGCSSQHIAFDHLGRPHNGIYGASNDYSSVVHQDCIFTFGFADSGIEDINIIIEKGTGHAYIQGQPDS